MRAYWRTKDGQLQVGESYVVVRAQYELTYSKYLCYERTHVVHLCYLDILEIVMLIDIWHQINKNTKKFYHTTLSNEKIGAFTGNRITDFTKSEDNDSWHTNHVDQCQRWGVVAATSKPTTAIARMTCLPSWCLVIIPDAKTPEHYLGTWRGSKDFSRLTRPIPPCQEV